MAKQESNCNVVIGGITFTPELVEAISELEEDAINENARDLVARNSLIIAAIEIGNYGIERKFFNYLLHLHNLYKALEGGVSNEQ